MTWIRASLLNKPTLSDPIPTDIIKLITFCNQPWIFIGRTDGEAEAPILWPLDVKSQLIRRDADAEKDWRQEEKGKTEDEMVGWLHQLNGHEFEKALGDGERQRCLTCYSPRGCKKSDMTEQLNNNNTENLPILKSIGTQHNYRLVFSSTWTENLQMYKPGFRKGRGTDIKLSTFPGS